MPLDPASYPQEIIGCAGRTQVAHVIHVDDSQDLRRARSGDVDCHNYARLGYVRLTHGVYGRLPDGTGLDGYQARRQRFLAHVRAVVTVYPKGSIALFGPTALQVLGVALPSSLEDWDNCHLLVRSGASRPRRHGVIAHRCNKFAPPRDFDGLPVQNPVDHWVQLRGASLEELVEVGDGLVRRKRPLLTMKQLLQRLDELAGTHGVAQVRRAARLVVPGTDSLYETRTRLIMIRHRLPQPTVNLPVKVRSTGFRYHVDMGYEEEQVGVEFDGKDHVGDSRYMDIDAARRRDLQDEGWIIINVTATHLNDPGPFVRSVEQALILRRSALHL